MPPDSDQWHGKIRLLAKFAPVISFPLTEAWLFLSKSAPKRSVGVGGHHGSDPVDGELPDSALCRIEGHQMTAVN